MNPFDHVGVLYSFIVSLGLAQVMTTFGALVKARRRVRFSGVFAIWLLVALLAHVDLWLQLWDYRLVRAWSTFQILTLLAWTASLFLMTTLIRPPFEENGGEPVDLPHFHREQGWTYIAAFLVSLAISIFADAMVSPSANAEDAAWNLAAALLVMCPWSLLAIFVRRPWAQWVGALGTLAVVAAAYAFTDPLS